MSRPFVTDLFVLTNPYLDDLGCEREKGHERGLREIHQLDPVWTLGSFWTLECKAKSFIELEVNMGYYPMDSLSWVSYGVIIHCLLDFGKMFKTHMPKILQVFLHESKTESKATLWLCQT